MLHLGGPSQVHDRWQNAPSSPTTTDTYLYDGQGNRVAQQVTQSGGSGSLTTTVYIGTIEEVATTNGVPVTTTYYYAGSQRIALAVNGAISYLGSDSLTRAPAPHTPARSAPRAPRC